MSTFARRVYGLLGLVRGVVRSASWVFWLALVWGLPGLASTPLRAEGVECSSAAIGERVGSSLVITGKVSVYRMTNESMRLLVRTATSDETWMARVARRKAVAFTNLDRLVGKNVIVRGKFGRDDDGPFLDVAHPSQIESEDASTPSEEVEIRYLALEARMKATAAHRRSNSIYYVNCHSCPSQVEAEVVRRLSEYAPVEVKPSELNERGGTGFRDEKRGGQAIAFWSVGIESRSDTEVEVQVDCREGPLIGIGFVVVLRKENGRWTYMHSEVRWLS